MRISLSKKLRFEVFKRDNFTCQYCGQRAPDVILACDHIKPVAEGGGNDILNLVTSCVPCNAGKGARELSNHAVLNKQLDQLAELNSRREQIEMMIEWRNSLSTMAADVVDRLVERWTALIEGEADVTPVGRDNLSKYVKKFGVDAVLVAMDEACNSYLKREGEEQCYSLDSIQRAFSAIGAVARVLKASEEKPYLKQLYYTRGILRKRLAYVNEWKVMKLMEEAVVLGYDPAELQQLAKQVRNWTQFTTELEDFIAAQEADIYGTDTNDKA